MMFIIIVAKPPSGGCLGTSTVEKCPPIVLIKFMYCGLIKFMYLCNREHPLSKVALCSISELILCGLRSVNVGGLAVVVSSVYKKKEISDHTTVVTILPIISTGYCIASE